MRMTVLLLLAGCPKSTDPGGTPPVPSTLPPSDAPVRSPDTPWADPRSEAPVAAHDPSAPPTEAYTAAMGKGPYLSALRKAIAPELEACLTSGPALVVTDAALVALVLDREGRAIEVLFTRTSGNEDFDRCIGTAFRSTRLPAPPIALLDQLGQLRTPDLAFR